MVIVLICLCLKSTSNRFAGDVSLGKALPAISFDLKMITGDLLNYVECSGGGGSVNVSPDVEPSHDGSCLPHFQNDCNRQGSNLLFGCLSVANILCNAFVLVQVSRFQQIIGVFTLQAPSEAAKVRER